MDSNWAEKGEVGGGAGWAIDASDISTAMHPAVSVTFKYLHMYSVLPFLIPLISIQ
jgi:hypothetical protein